MRISFEQTIQDYADFCYYYYKQQKSWRKGIHYISLSITSICLLVLLYYSFLRGDGSDLLPVLFIVAYIIYALVIRSKWGFLKRVERLWKSGKNPDMVGARTLVFEEEKLKVITPTSETNINWKNGFEYLRETPKHLLLFTAVNQAILIPKRIFLLDQELFEVRDFIESHLPPEKNTLS